MILLSEMVKTQKDKNWVENTGKKKIFLNMQDKNHVSPYNNTNPMVDQI